MKTRQTQTGFTLIEMAVVLVIIALLLGGVLAPLSTQKEQQHREENQKLLNDAMETLLGFAIVNGALPCPDTSGDGLSDACAVDDTQIYSGRLPWATLGINAEFDPWGEGHVVNYTVHGTYVGSFDLDAEADAQTGLVPLMIYDNAADCGSNNNKVADNVPAVVWTSAKTFYNLPPTSSADEIENTDGDQCFVVRDYNTVANFEFDDQMVWVSPSLLFNRMVSAQRLP